jgi:4'-phosphopantetheinyl transferase
MSMSTNADPSEWVIPAEHPNLTHDSVHVWRSRLDASPLQVAKFRQTLSEDEIARADRLHFQRDSNRFIAAHAALRVILGHYLGCDTAMLAFTCNAHGKPCLLKPVSSGIDFNLSHSGDIALCAFTRGRQVGVDVERIREGAASEDLAERYFSPIEVQMLLSVPASLRPRAFFNCWTRKEAYIKARGAGLSLPLSRFAVSQLSGEPARLLWTSGDPDEVSRWRLEELTPESGYVGALAVEGNDWTLRQWHWEEG